MFIHKMLFGFLTMLTAAGFTYAGQTDTCHLNVATAPSTQVGGRYITASGTINVLFVYVQFPDDNWLPSSSNWPKGQAPAFMNATVDSVWSSTPTAGSMTDFFNQMSFYNLKITGKAVSVITPHTRVWYLTNNKQAGDIHKEVLQQLDATMDFAQFDHWHYNNTYSHTNSADGFVDMIFMMWRNVDSDTIINNNPIRSRLNLEPGGYAALTGSSFTVDGGARTINTSYGGNQSGVTIINPVGSDLSSGTLWRYARHEFSHFLLGGNNYHTDLGMWGLLSSFGTPSDCINSFERERLGWMNFNTIDDISTPRTITTVTLPDFVNSNTAYRIKVPGGGADEYYLLENHQRSSVFDIPDANFSNAKGLFVIRQRDSTGNGTGLVSAEGRFNWSVVAMSGNIYGSNPAMLPVFKRGTSNKASGYDRRKRIPWSYPGYSGGPIQIEYELINNDTLKSPPRIFIGTGKDQFDFITEFVFTPSSNPSSDLYNDSNKVGFEITGINNGNVVLNIHVNTTVYTSPSKPQDLAVAPYYVSGQYYPKLTWTANTEPDLTGYQIWKRSFVNNHWFAYSLAATVNSATTQWIDYDSWGAGDGSRISEYKICSVDNQNKVSTFTDPKQIAWGIRIGEKIEVPIVKLIPSEYSLKQNYPNPFNPATTLRYELPNDEHVILKVYDMLGKEIATVVNGFKQAGYYEERFDASSLTSGVYVYRFTAGQYTSVGKMLL